MRNRLEPETLVLKRAEVQRAPVARAGRRLLKEAVTECAAEEATLWLISQDGLEMEGTLNHGKKPEVLEHLSVPVSSSIVGMVAANGLATSIGPDDWHNMSVEEKVKLPVKAMIVAPVYVRGKLCGAISAINPRPASPTPAASVGTEDQAHLQRLFSTEELATLQWKAYLLGLVLTSHVDSQ